MAQRKKKTTKKTAEQLPVVDTHAELQEDREKARANTKVLIYNEFRHCLDRPLHEAHIQRVDYIYDEKIVKVMTDTGDVFTSASFDENRFTKRTPAFIVDLNDPRLLHNHIVHILGLDAPCYSIDDTKAMAIFETGTHDVALLRAQTNAAVHEYVQDIANLVGKAMPFVAFSVADGICADLREIKNRMLEGAQEHDETFPEDSTDE